jgi:hypothetical protein
MFRIHFGFTVSLRTAFSVACLLWLFCLNLPAITGGVSGRILDPRGVPVAGAHLKLVTTAGGRMLEMPKRISLCRRLHA